MRPFDTGALCVPTCARRALAGMVICGIQEGAMTGIWAMVAACVIWGLSPLYYALLRDVPALEVLSWRALWSLIFFAGFLALRGGLEALPRALRVPQQRRVIAAAGILISLNWFGFIFAIQNGYAVEASLGYYIFPLVAVVMGFAVFGEALSALQWGAVALAAVAVVGLTLGLGAAPWIALILATTFGGYGVMKKRLDLDPVVSVTAEVLLLSPLALAWLAWQGGALDHSALTLILLALSGPITGAPLILFSYAARRARLSTVGLIQYLNPSLQMLCATLVLAEPFTRWHAMAFPVIWLALALYSVAGLRQDRARRSAVSSAARSGMMSK